VSAALVFLLALGLRVGWVLAVPSKPVGDFAMYVESAAHLVKLGSFDHEYIFMPGYVFLLAGVQALGGGWLACKLVGAVAGAVAAAAAYGIALQVWNCRRAALLAGLLGALWPAGIAQASVTGTDMPAAALMGLGGFFLVRHAALRPWRAAVMFGVFMGLATSIRAIAFPLCVLALLPLRAAGQGWRKSLRGTVLACAVAALLLVPWAVRNRLRYGEAFIGDSHGGVTTLVGANPNSDGNYSRSLNRMFAEVTGMKVLGEPHRQVDRASLALALPWIGFDPAFTLGQLVFKAERLLVRERGLFYWPLFRAGVLPPAAAFTAGCWRTFLENLADGFWMIVLGAALVGLAQSILRRRWLALSLVPLVVVLSGLYIAIFSEPRYRLPMALVVFVFAAAGLTWAGQTVWQAMRERRLPGAARREIGLAVGLCLLTFMGGPLLARAGAGLRDRHRWSVQVCRVDQTARLCSWRHVGKNLGDGRPVVRGVWDGVGLAIPGARPEGAQESLAETELDLPRGAYTVEAALDIAPIGDPSRVGGGGLCPSGTDASGPHALPPSPTAFGRALAPTPERGKAWKPSQGFHINGVADGHVSWQAEGLNAEPLSLIAVAHTSRIGGTLSLQGELAHPGGKLHLRLRVAIPAGDGQAYPGRLWASGLQVTQRDSLTGAGEPVRAVLH
jgi:hypothetical protein